MKKIALIYGYHESGHYFVAKALQEQTREVGFESEIYNIFKNQSSAVDDLFKIFRNVANNNIPIFPPFLNDYALLDKLSKHIKLPSDLLNSDIIISTHPYASYVLAAQKNTKQKLIDVHTDYTPFPIFSHNNIDAYCGTIPKKQVESSDARKMFSTGIPIRKSIIPSTKNSSILLMSGSDGFGDLNTAVEIGQKLFPEKQVDIVCGRNQELYDKLSNQYSNHNIYGFVENIHELLGHADYVLTKPSGVTITEALISKAIPIYLPSNLPWENDAAQILTGLNIGFRITPNTNLSVVSNLINSQSFRQHHFNATAQLPYVDASKAILEIATDKNYEKYQSYNPYSLENLSSKFSQLSNNSLELDKIVREGLDRWLK